ncbi:hypothetical protein [Verrucomicrobium sp. BvORR106]|uniref:hypothetical protein n=1 Tax=Verrucomicrobium sp. BvORR106 TaxID=1403819 RepID=UPI002240FAC6|nr:hypothetical protein [Verrucomicrobium sp. BvORR106]
MDFKLYTVDRNKRTALVDYISEALRACGCRLLFSPDPGTAPYRFTFELPDGERMGIVAYAFFANRKETINRPQNEHRFQVKYGTDDKLEHEIWQDPYGLYTTLFLGIDPERGTFVGADPNLHNPTRFFKSIEYKDRHSSEILTTGWHAWERDRRNDSSAPVEILVGGTSMSFLNYVKFEREAKGEAQGHRQLLAEKPQLWTTLSSNFDTQNISSPDPARLHQLSEEFQLSETEVLDLIASARRLKMAVRGWVAEEHLVRRLNRVDGVSSCQRIDAEGQPDVRLLYRGVPLVVECKNVLRKTTAEGLARMDFQRTRASKSDPCSRYYSICEFDIVAACLHAVEEQWTFRFAIPMNLDIHPKCPTKLSNNVKIDDRWLDQATQALDQAARLKN